MADMITGIRMVLSILMVFFPPFSARFYTLYLLCGLSDMLDGWVARKTHTAGKFGAQLDTLADFVFFTAALIKLLPVLEIPKWLWIWVIVIAIIKLCNGISGFLFRKRWIVEHTIMNKLTGLLLFFLPLTLDYIDFRYSTGILCAIATFSAIQEGHYIRTGREVDEPTRRPPSPPP